MINAEVKKKDDSINDVVNEIIDLIEIEADAQLSEAVKKQIAKWTNEIAATTSSWVRTRNMIYIITSSWAALKVSRKIKDALDKLKK
jgi:hypothetical protein